MEIRPNTPFVFPPFLQPRDFLKSAAFKQLTGRVEFTKHTHFPTHPSVCAHVHPQGDCSFAFVAEHLHLRSVFFLYHGGFVDCWNTNCNPPGVGALSPPSLPSSPAVSACPSPSRTGLDHFETSNNIEHIELARRHIGSLSLSSYSSQRIYSPLVPWIFDQKTKQKIKRYKTAPLLQVSPLPQLQPPPPRRDRLVTDS